jgi:hypothetical protein
VGGAGACAPSRRGRRPPGGAGRRPGRRPRPDGGRRSRSRPRGRPRWRRTGGGRGRPGGHGRSCTGPGGPGSRAGRPARRRRGGGAGRAPWRVLVDVVAQVQDHVEVVLGQVPVGGVVALLDVLAGHEGQVQATEGAARVGAGPGAADPAQVAAGPEPVPVAAARVDLPVDRDRPGRHPGVGLQGPGRQSGPEHHPGRGGVAGGHPEAERVVRPGALGGPGPRDPLGREQGGGAGRPGQEQPATDRRRGRGGIFGWVDVRHDQAPLGCLEAADHSGSRER